MCLDFFRVCSTNLGRGRLVGICSSGCGEFAEFCEPTTDAQEAPKKLRGLLCVWKCQFFFLKPLQVSRKLKKKSMSAGPLHYSSMGKYKSPWRALSPVAVTCGGPMAITDGQGAKTGSPAIRSNNTTDTQKNEIKRECDAQHSLRTKLTPGKKKTRTTSTPKSGVIVFIYTNKPRL